MPKAKRQVLPDLETRLGYRFQNRELLREALTHSSAKTRRGVGSDNQRLEFLGDRVLGLVMADELLRRFPQAREGELARRLNFLVRKERCAEAATAAHLGADLILDAGEADAGGRRKDSILAGACEAVLGAVFVDGGFAAARDVTLKLWGDNWDTARAASSPDAKTALQEWAQARKLPIPRYVLLGAEGPPHAPKFIIEAHIETVPPARGDGASKRAAEQAAAASLLTREGVWTADG
ncbi:MAG: ribonuclease III [Hyphomicrobiales bacterium]|nr:ribonuclease III [Hyphomicrobiales bacterium]